MLIFTEIWALSWLKTSVQKQTIPYTQPLEAKIDLLKLNLNKIVQNNEFWLILFNILISPWRYNFSNKITILNSILIKRRSSVFSFKLCDCRFGWFIDLCFWQRFALAVQGGTSLTILIRIYFAFTFIYCVRLCEYVCNKLQKL